ncbi:hypothetical protein SGGMMB4_02682 [Sodalis glossinidius str. 'morsitans']|nr:hypothetical protein [Sodalis glossinidius]CRL45138.1 hypothetical protein SGGMMB4_02682 [Sodalis glossinidius str. 'morsitans']
MLNTDERLYYSGAGDTLKALLIHIYQEEAYKRSREDKSIEQDFANRAKQIATSVRDAYLALLDNNCGPSARREGQGVAMKDADPDFLEDGRADAVAEALAKAAEALCPAGQVYPLEVLNKAREIIKSRPIGYYFDITLESGPQPRK